MPRPALVVAYAALSLAVSLALQGCGARVKPEHEKTHAGRQEAPRPIPAKTDEFIQSPDESPLSETQGPECPGFVLKDAHGSIHVLESQVGKSPTILCPRDYEYKGPRIECGWVDQLCEVHGLQDVVSKDHCMLKYGLTHEGKGLVTWPKHAMPRLVSDTSNLGSAVEYNAGKRDVSALPSVIDKSTIVCEKEGYVDLDFEHAKITETYPPYTQDSPWSKLYEGIAAVDNQKVDMVVTRTDGRDPPGNVWQDGNSSATGRINMNGREQSTLKFQFVESGTLRPVALKKFFFTVFDLADGKDGRSNKKVGASGMAEYYLSRSTQLQANQTVGDSYVFTGASGLPRDEEPAVGAKAKFSGADGKEEPSELENMWLSSLERSVVLMFRKTAAFSIQVQAVPFPNGQVLEFAGWSELVGEGARVPTIARKESDGSEVVIRDALSDQPFVDEVTSAFSMPRKPHGSVVLQPSHRWTWAKMAFGASALVAAAGLVAYSQQQRSGCSDSSRESRESRLEASEEPFAAE